MIWSFAFGAPLLVAVLLAAAALEGRPRSHRLRKVLSRYAWLAVLPAGAAVFLGDDAEHRVDWMLLGTGVQLDSLGRPLLGMTVVLYGLALAFIPRSGIHKPHALTGFMLLCFTGNAGVFVASDLLTFYLSFTVMSFVAYAVVVHKRNDEARRAGTIYLVMTVLGECAVLAALLFIASEGTTAIAEAPAAVAASARRDLIIALLLIGFGVKAGTVPLHVWLPLAHPAAPTPASAVLSGAMVKAGLIGWLRFLPLGEGQAEPGWGAAFIVLALLGGFLAVPIGLLQDDPKVVLAYSSISQMGFLAALVGVGLAVPSLAQACVLAAVVYAVHHGLAKGALFLGVQAWDTERLPRVAVAAAMAVAGLSLIGAPFTSGFVAKYGAKEAVGSAPLPGGGVELASVLPWVGLGSTLLLARFAIVMWRRTRDTVPTPVLRDAAWALVAVGGVVPVWCIAQSFSPVQKTPEWLSASTLWDQSWPLLLGAALALAAAWASRSAGLADSRLAHPRGDTVPPGDLVAVEERAVRAGLRLLRRGSTGLAEAGGRLRERFRARPSPVPLLDAGQRRLGSWAGSGTVLLFLVAAALLWARWKGAA